MSWENFEVKNQIDITAFHSLFENQFPSDWNFDGESHDFGWAIWGRTFFEPFVWAIWYVPKRLLNQSVAYMCVLFYTLFIAVIESIVNIVVNILLNVRGAVLLTHKKMHSYTILGQKRNHTCWYTNVISYVAKTGKKVHFRGNFKVRNPKSTPPSQRNPKSTPFSPALTIVGFDNAMKKSLILGGKRGRCLNLVIIHLLRTRPFRLIKLLNSNFACCIKFFLFFFRKNNGQNTWFIFCFYIFGSNISDIKAPCTNTGIAFLS